MALGFHVHGVHRIGSRARDDGTHELYLEERPSWCETDQRVSSTVYLKKRGVERGNAEGGIGEVAGGGADDDDEGDCVVDGHGITKKDEADVRRRTWRIEDICEGTTHYYQTSQESRR